VASPLMLVAVIAYGCSALVNMLVAKEISEGLEGVVIDGTSTFAFDYAERLRTVLHVSMIPLALIAIGLIMLYMTAKDMTKQEINTTGLRVIHIGLIAYFLPVGILFYTGLSTVPDEVVFPLLIVLALVVLYYCVYIKVVWDARAAIEEYATYMRFLTFAGVLKAIIAGGLVLAVFISFESLPRVILFPLLLLLCAQGAFAVLIFMYRNRMDMIE